MHWEVINWYVFNKREHGYKLNQIYEYFTISKQAVHQHEKRMFERTTYHQGLIDQSRAIRQHHPRMGAKIIYDKIQPDNIGRVRFEGLLMKHGFRLRKLKNYLRTTDSGGMVRYKNIIAGRKFNKINQVWVSDISYYLIGQDVYYIVILMDLYSRRILGYAADRTLRAKDMNIKSLRMALKQRGIRVYENLIHHSDRGSQYRYQNYVNTLGKRHIQISMCRNVYDNPHMERVNGTIKNDYLYPLHAKDLKSLRSELKRTVQRYNQERPHSSLNKKTPIEFENYIASLSAQKRPKMRIKEEAANRSYQHINSN